MSPTSASTDPISKAYQGIPNWVGFGLIILAGVGLIVMGATIPNAGAISLGVATIASAIIAWVSGASAEPRVDPFKKSFGGTVRGIKQILWINIFGLYVVAVLITIFTT